MVKDRERVEGGVQGRRVYKYLDKSRVYHRSSVNKCPLTSTYISTGGWKARRLGPEGDCRTEISEWDSVGGERLKTSTRVEEGWELGCWVDHHMASGTPRMKQVRRLGRRGERRESPWVPHQVPKDPGAPVRREGRGPQPHSLWVPDHAQGRVAGPLS